MAPSDPEVILGPVKVGLSMARLVKLPDGSGRTEVLGPDGWTAPGPPAASILAEAFGLWVDETAGEGTAPPTGMPTLEDAILLAAQAHPGQADKAGRPLILHALRVMFRLGSDVERIVGVLHDVVEDGGYTLDRLREMGYSAEVLRALECLTKREAESYEEFIRRVQADPLAQRVKVADLEDNLDLRRLPELTEEDLERVGKYHRAWSQLTGRSVVSPPHVAEPAFRTVVLGPMRVGGVLTRIVDLPDGSGRVETWGPDGWTPGGVDIASVMAAPPASPEILAALGVPSEGGDPMKADVKDWQTDRQANPHVLFGGGYDCPVRGWTYFLTVDGTCPGCGAEVKEDGTVPEASRMDQHHRQRWARRCLALAVGYSLGVWGVLVAATWWHWWAMVNWLAPEPPTLGTMAVWAPAALAFALWAWFASRE